MICPGARKKRRARGPRCRTPSLMLMLQKITAEQFKFNLFPLPFFRRYLAQRLAIGKRHLDAFHLKAQLVRHPTKSEYHAVFGCRRIAQPRQPGRWPVIGRSGCIFRRGCTSSCITRSLGARRAIFRRPTTVVCLCHEV